LFRGIVPGTMLTLLLMGMLTSAFNIGIVGTGGTIHTFPSSLSSESSTHGPRMDSLYVRYYVNSGALYDALKNGEVDLTDLELTEAQMDEVFNDTSIQAAISPSSTIFEFDFNNNATTPTYPNWTNPTAYKQFRQGIACLVNKTHIVNDICKYSYRIDTPFPRPNDDWWVDWSVSQYDSYGDLLGNYPYEYDPELAAHYFDLGGFMEGSNQSNPYYDENFTSSAHYMRTYPAGHPRAGLVLDPLILYIRNDDPRRLEAGRYLRDNSRKMGIPITAIEANLTTCRDKVMKEGDYHIYTGGWSYPASGSWIAPDSLIPDLSIFSSEFATGDLMANYPQFRNATYDEWSRKVMYPQNLTLAREAALECQEILVQEAVCVWLWSPSRVMGYRNVYGIVNQRGGRIDNQWTFLKASNSTAKTGINYGLRYTPTSLNVVTDGSRYAGLPEGDCLDHIYDTLIAYCPYDRTPGEVLGNDNRGGIMPWMAEDWEIGEWESPYNSSEKLTMLTFHLRDGIRWHDGVELNSTDVKFTVDYLKGLGNVTSLNWAVSDVYSVMTPDSRTIIVYENVSSVRTFDNIGKLPILPKHIFQSIGNVTGYTPGASEGRPANETLIGSGPWKYVSHNSSMLCLEANEDYFMETPPMGEVDFRYDWELGYYPVDNADRTMIAEAYESSGNGVPSAKWEPGCDLNGDGTVDVINDMFTIQYDLYPMGWGISAKRSFSQPPTECTLRIEPLENQALLGGNITVQIRLINAVKLCGYQLKIGLDPVKVYPWYPINHSMPLNYGGTWPDVSGGIIYFYAVLLSYGQPFSGNTTLATIVFNATGSGSSALDLLNVKLLAYGAPGSTCQLMPHKVIGGNAVIGVPTPSGTNVTVAPAQNVNVTFNEIADPGNTTLRMIQPPQIPFVTANCFDINTTANYSGNITIQFAYDPTGLTLEDEEAMKIWLWNETALNWVDITTYVNTTSNIVYGTTPHLSIFGVTNDLIMYGDTSIFGVTTVGVPASPPNAPAGFKMLNCYEIHTTKNPPMPIEVRLAYDAQAVSPEEEDFIRLWRWDGSQTGWVDITEFINTTSKIVYGETEHLFIFGVTTLMPPPEGIDVINVDCAKTVVNQGYNVTMEFTVENHGRNTENFDIIVYRNSTSIETFPVMLNPTNQQTFTRTWNTASWPLGKTAIITCSHLMKWVLVTRVGDVAPEYGAVDIFDIVTVALVFGSAPPKDPNADINNDGVVDIFDIVIVALHFGES
jgi:ABC-type transport system substrate-binding protein